jgi:hypothetical protein
MIERPDALHVARLITATLSADDMIVVDGAVVSGTALSLIRKHGLAMQRYGMRLAAETCASAHHFGMTAANCAEVILAEAERSNDREA